MFQISIPKPCHEDWIKMTPTIKGAFCKSCAKEVVDFTRMTDDEVQNYFLNKTDGGTCGRFNAVQIQQIKIELPANILFKKMASWKKFMAIILLAFGSMIFGCDVSTTADTTTGIVLTEVKQDSSVCKSTMGTPALIVSDTIINKAPQVIVGELMVENVRDSLNLIKSDSLVNANNIVRNENLDTSVSNIFTGGLKLTQKDSVEQKPIAKPIVDSTKIFNSKAAIDTLISE